jgi:hypothetical protein
VFLALCISFPCAQQAKDAAAMGTVVKKKAKSAAARAQTDGKRVCVFGVHLSASLDHMYQVT